ncbi:cytochrome P450 [Reticulibacter mediterranei]|uniref:Cytochrome P450 n=1 Tax=Reticulibacter mediterranei TaxID=2778369 RepID=A0A8J3IEY6_9CHLR|nr:cytochrome P450 [Reticulibacter mediterranei]GHO93146.1 cytochrome P450 [Reticulibacter mediterranei]
MHHSTAASHSTNQASSGVKPQRKHIPGPLWPTAARNTIRFAHQALSFVQELRERYGDLVTLPTMLGPWTLVFHPDGVRHVVQENHKNYRKGGISNHVLRLTLGNGLLTNNGDSWLQQRRLIQPIFHRKQIAAFGQLMTESTLAWIEEGNLDTSQPLDLFQQMSGLTLSIVCKALFGADMVGYKKRVFVASSMINYLEAQAFYVPGLLSLPTPQRHRLYKARNTLYTVVDELIAERRKSAAQSENDLLTMLLQARDEETGLGMSDQQVRDEVLTLMVAGHETTANALCWTLMLLAQHPDIEARLREEYISVLSGRAPQMEDLPQLKLTRIVLEESMRLYPPAWAFARQAIDEDEIGGYRIAKGAYILMFPVATHRHPDFWEQPDVFDPERFSPERAAGRHRFAYFPFGGGPRVCIGNQFALTEAQLVLATILSRYQLRLLPGANIVPEPLITLRPRGGLLMTVHPYKEL